MATKKFEIGLCMAGAVSAGAYTAGVMDYLIEALSEWEKRRGDPSTPQHEVCIPIIGGASAGGMTALLMASTINNPITPVDLPTQGNLLAVHPENKLYNGWVDLTGDDMFPKMLATDDIEGGKVISFLNSKFIDEVAEKMIRTDIKKWVETPAFFKSKNNIPVKIFTTLTNLEGFSYYAGTNSGGKNERYYMTVHNDYACFEVIDRVAKPSGNEWIPLDFREDNTYLKTAKDAAMATGAFPLGLEPRLLTRESKYIKHIPWLQHVFANSPLENDVVTSLNVDGGLINNEPFEKVRYLLNENVAAERDMPFASQKEINDTCASLEKENADYGLFENTVLMIDPFPSEKNNNFTLDKDLFGVVPKTLSAMLSQMRAKPGEYRDALTIDASSFLISPSRDIRDKQGNIIEEVFGERAIACGTLSGFGGFLNKEFRIHDYYLGRYNCEIFLRDYFTIPASALVSNPIFKDGYQKVPDLEKFASLKTKPAEEKRYQIIPIFTERKGFKIPIFSSGLNWPVIKESDIDRFDKPIRRRVEKILMNMLELKGISKPLMYIGSKVIINKLATKKVVSIIKNSLHEWKLMNK
jgi:hypothetical protein